MPRRLLSCLACAAIVLSLVRRAGAGNPETPETAPRPEADATFLDHSGPGRFWFGAEINTIFQYKPAFSAAYTGPNSLRSEAESATSGLLTMFFAFAPFRTTELILDGEMALGGGLSDALGVAGFPNLDVVRNPSLSHEPYLARVQIHQVVPLSRDWIPNPDRGPTNSLVAVPRHRLELRFGKLSTVDLFDINPAASDAHLQFMNWAVDNNGAYDFAADTRGYTYGLSVEYQGPFLELRFGLMLMPKVANGIDLEFDFTQARAENAEVEWKYSTRPNWAGTLRLLGYVNHANMGSYREAIAAFLAMRDPAPNIVAHRQQGRKKGGLGINWVQELAGCARAFARIGWNDGENESFAFTEIDDTVELGFDLRGVFWKRSTDQIGLAFVTSGISDLHREYLRLGGRGFLLGDGALRYARETIVEHYYNLHIWRGAFAAADLQWIGNPGFNADRGPAYVLSLRGHLEF
jgi:hypothetical protein